MISSIHCCKSYRRGAFASRVFRSCKLHSEGSQNSPNPYAARYLALCKLESGLEPSPAGATGEAVHQLLCLKISARDHEALAYLHSLERILVIAVLPFGQRDTSIYGE